MDADEESRGRPNDGQMNHIGYCTNTVAGLLRTLWTVILYSVGREREREGEKGDREKETASIPKILR